MKDVEKDIENLKLISTAIEETINKELFYFRGFRDGLEFAIANKITGEIPKIHFGEDEK